MKPARPVSGENSLGQEGMGSQTTILAEAMSGMELGAKKELLAMLVLQLALPE